MAKVIISPEAMQDVQNAIGYLELECKAPQTTQNLKEEFSRQIRQLDIFPDMGTPLKAVADLVLDYRFLLVSHYLVFYHSTNSETHVIRVLDARSNYVKTLTGDIVDLP